MSQRLHQGVVWQIDLSLRNRLGQAGEGRLHVALEICQLMQVLLYKSKAA
jgi:hypothetical protein